MGTPDLCPRVPGDWPRTGCARRVSGNFPARVSGPQGLPRAGEILLLALSYRVESVPRLCPSRTPDAGRTGAGGRRPDGSRRRARAVGIDRGSRRQKGPRAYSGTRDGPLARRTAHGDHLKGISRVDVPGNRRPGRLPVEHGEDAALSGIDGAPAGAGREWQVEGTRPTKVGRPSVRRLDFF